MVAFAKELAAGMTIKSPLPGSEALLCKVHERLGPNRLPLLIAIDGADGIGKSSLASWLAWQLGAPAIPLDLYLVRDSDPLRWRSDELQRILNTRLVEHVRPVVVEGILILEALDKIGRRPDFLVHLDGEGSHSLSNRLADYRAQYQPEQQAHFRLQGFAE
jgi:uridine kinase